MHSFFDPRYDPALVDENGCMPEFTPGPIFPAKLDASPASVPLFLKFFRRQSTPKDCMVCSASLFEIDYTNVETWKAECEAFKGPWIWNIFVFPTSEVLQCHHDFDICKRCTAQHIRSTLASGGPAACELLSCPQCNRQLSHSEIQQLADAETFAK